MNDDTVVKIPTPYQELYVVNDAKKVIHLCSDCIIPSDKAGYVKNTENCDHILPYIKPA